ncbi:MAG: magnesium-translocating P-type ATPase [Streptosporangiaceae bacterium]|jgi:Mg2+-importing ATPase
MAEYAAAAPLQVLRGLDSAWRGLDETEAQDRLIRLGDNTLAVGRLPHWGRRVLTAARNPFVVILICLTVVSAATGDLDGAVVITAMVVISCVLRVRQEYRSDLAAAALRAMVATTATVVRRASATSRPCVREVPVDQLVPGDIVQLAPGDMVPADVRLLKSDDLAVNQAVLTGESLPAAKRAAAVITQAARDGETSQAGSPADRTSVFDSPRLCFMGTTVVSGSGTSIVVCTGTSTYLGASHQEQPHRTAGTSFDRGVRSVTRLLLGFMLVCVPVVLAVNATIRGHPVEAFLFAVAVAVGLTPEMLPVVVTAALAQGARVMAGRAAIVKRLPALHNLGAMDVLCTDKTGTLTEDRISVDCFLDAAGGTDLEVMRLAWLNSYWSTAYAEAATADLLDQALLDRGESLGMMAEDSPDVIGIIPFDFSRRRVTVVTRTGFGSHELITKGAAEEVLACCTRVRADGRDVPLEEDRLARALMLIDSYARDGVRLVAVAVAARQAKSGRYQPGDEAGLALAGFVGFRDPPRASAPQAVTDLARHGIAVKVLTGDHPLVAARVCRDVGVDPGRVLTGQDAAQLDDAELVAVAEATTVFARVDPAQKARIVRALQAGGRTVGFLGDGVNDAAALRDADVGISVAGAAALARECADIILLRKELPMLGQAVIEGRRSVSNIAKYLKITVSSNVGNVLSMLAASAALPFLPMLPLQVLAQNLCFDVCQLSLAFDTVDESSLDRPRAFDSRDLARFVLRFGPVNTLADLAIFVFLWRLMGTHASPAGQALFRTGWFAENLVTQSIAVHLLRSPSLPSPRRHAARPVLLATLVLALTGLCLPLTPLGTALRLEALPVAYFPVLAVVIVGYCAATIAAKARYLRRTAPWL